jgi:hypothetical protein
VQSDLSVYRSADRIVQERGPRAARPGRRACDAVPAAVAEPGKPVDQPLRVGVAVLPAAIYELIQFMDWSALLGR